MVADDEDDDDETMLVETVVGKMMTEKRQAITMTRTMKNSWTCIRQVLVKTNPTIKTEAKKQINNNDGKITTSTSHIHTRKCILKQSQTNTQGKKKSNRASSGIEPEKSLATALRRYARANTTACPATTQTMTRTSTAAHEKGECVSMSDSRKTRADAARADSTSRRREGAAKKRVSERGAEEGSRMAARKASESRAQRQERERKRARTDRGIAKVDRSEHSTQKKKINSNERS